MSDKLRQIVNNDFIYIRCQGVQDDYIFKNRLDKLRYLCSIERFSKLKKIHVIAYCILDNCVELIIFCDSTKNMSSFMHSINGSFARFYNNKYNKSGPVFRNRFFSKVICSELDLLQYIKYVHVRPVKACVVKKECDYDFSSYNSYFNNNNFKYNKIVFPYVLNHMFRNNDNYLIRLNSVEYKDIKSDAHFSSDDDVIDEYINEYVERKGISFMDLVSNRKELRSFVSNIDFGKIHINKKRLSDKLMIGRTTLYKIIKEVKGS